MILSQMLLAQSAAPSNMGGVWEFVVLVLLILFLTLVATDGSKDKDQ